MHFKQEYHRHDSVFIMYSVGARDVMCPFACDVI